MTRLPSSVCFVFKETKRWPLEPTVQMSLADPVLGNCKTRPSNVAFRLSLVITIRFPLLFVTHRELACHQTCRMPELGLT